jgi:hypothetical protein
MYNTAERTSLGWEKVGDAWQKRFPIGGGAELTVIVGQEEDAVDGLVLTATGPGGNAPDSQHGARLEDWTDQLPPEALIEIIAKRDIHRAAEPAGS